MSQSSGTTSVSDSTPANAPQGRVHAFIQLIATHSWAISSLMVLVAVLYSPIHEYQFLNWDDEYYVVNNDLIKSWHPANLWKVMTEPVARNYAPLTITTFLVEHTLWGLEPGGYHITNLILHALNTVLVFALIRQLTGNSWTAWFVAGLFAVHPMQIESVAWVSSRKTLLSSTFMLLCGLSYLREDRTLRDEGWGLLWLILGLLSKASSVVVPPIVFAYDMLIRRRSFEQASGPQIIPTFFCVLLTFVTMGAQVTIIGGIRGHLELNKLQLIGVDATLLFHYLSLLLYPRDLCVLYAPPFRDIPLQIAGSLAVWIGLTMTLWRNRARYPWLAFAWASWLWLLFPVMNFFPITTLMNDRYVYLPCLVVFTVLVEGGRRAARLCVPTLQGTRAIPVTLAGIVIMGYLVASRQYLPVFRDPQNLWSYARQKTPTLATVHIQWALTLRSQGKLEEAIESLEEASERQKFEPDDQNRILSMISEWKTSKPAPSPR